MTEVVKQISSWQRAEANFYRIGTEAREFLSKHRLAIAGVLAVGVAARLVIPALAAVGELCGGQKLTCELFTNNTGSTSLFVWHVPGAPVDQNQVLGGMGQIGSVTCEHAFQNQMALASLAQPDMGEKEVFFAVDVGAVGQTVCIGDKISEVEDFARLLSANVVNGSQVDPIPVLPPEEIVPAVVLPAIDIPVEVPGTISPGKVIDLDGYILPALGVILGTPVAIWVAVCVFCGAGALADSLADYLGNDDEGRAMEKRLVKTDADELVWGLAKGRLTLPAGASGKSAIIVNETVENGTRMVMAKVGQIITAGETFAFDHKTVSYVHMPENDFNQATIADLDQAPDFGTNLPEKY